MRHMRRKKEYQIVGCSYIISRLMRYKFAIIQFKLSKHLIKYSISDLELDTRKAQYLTDNLHSYK